MTSFAIELERQNGIYYAGEVVRGTVKLRCGSAVKCRSVSVQFNGQAKIHWHTGSGDDRSDHDGNTLFEDQRYTIRGNFYKTGLLDNAGENAYFDKIHNLGVIQIPCSSQETQQLQLIVRVMDYDWGRKDDLLGEVLLDVPALAKCGEKQSFPLTREGRSEKGEATMSAKYMPYDALFPTTSQSGTKISGDIQQDYCLILHIHQATGLRKADWAGKNDVYVQVYRPEDSKPGEIMPGKKLPGPQKRMTLPANTEIVAPFCFSLRRDAPPSAELGDDDYSHIRYKIRAYVDIANWRDPFAKTNITVIPSRPIPKPLLIQPYVEEVGPEPLYSSCCKIGKSGMVSTRLELNRIAFAAGEAVDLSGSTVLYEGNKEIYADVFLVGQYRLDAYDYSTSTNRNFSMGPRVRLIPFQEISLKNTAFRIPAAYPSFYGGVTEHEWMHYACLKWTYTISIVVGGEGCVSSVVAALPVLISSSPPYESALAEYKGVAPKKVSFGPWDIFEHAVLGPDEGSNIAPTITGPEDGGTTVHMGSPINTWEGAEDNYFVGSGGQESMSYQPMVTTFDGPQDSHQAAAFTDTTSASSSAASADIGTLLQTMDAEFDKRLAVGQWIRQHPDEAQSLSPEDFHLILGKVTFSLDQPSVVGELLAGFEASNKLTCRHITETMAACQYQKTEVASMMAPYANDPENKDLVLQQLDYSFDKGSVSARFAA